MEKKLYLCDIYIVECECDTGSDDLLSVANSSPHAYVDHFKNSYPWGTFTTPTYTYT